jgi:hypothetical protein
MKPIESMREAFLVAIEIIDAQERLIESYRIGRSVGVATDVQLIMQQKPRLAAWLDS